jgi:hypothetical protein
MMDSRNMIAGLYDLEETIGNTYFNTELDLNNEVCVGRLFYSDQIRILNT